MEMNGGISDFAFTIVFPILAVIVVTVAAIVYMLFVRSKRLP